MATYSELDQILSRQNAGVLAKISVSLWRAADAIMNEGTGVALHPERLAFAQRIIGPEGGYDRAQELARRFVSSVMRNGSIQANPTGTADSGYQSYVDNALTSLNALKLLT